MATTIPNGATHVNLGSPNYGGAVSLYIGPGSVTGGGTAGFGPGPSAVYSTTSGITLTDASTSDLQAGDGANGVYFGGGISLGLPPGAGGIGVQLQASDTFINAGTVTGGTGGASPAPGDGSGGTGGAGVALSNGAYLKNTGSVTGGAGGLNAGGGSRSFGGDAVDAAGGHIVNSGALSGGTALNEQIGGAGVQLTTGTTSNYLLNTATGTITGGAGSIGGGIGVEVTASAVAQPIDLVNQGTIVGGSSARGGIGLYLGVDDQASNSGSIEGGSGVSTQGYGGTGIELRSGSTFTSTGGSITGGSGSGTGKDGIGLYIAGSAAGSPVSLYDTRLSGGTQTGDVALKFSKYSAGTLTINGTDTFTGLVEGSYSANDQLDLSGTGILSGGLGTQFTGFSQLTFDAGAVWTVDATSGAFSGAEPVSGFSLGDRLHITDLSPAYETGSNFISTGSNSGILQILFSQTVGDETDNTQFDLTLNNLPNAAPAFSVTADRNGGIDVQLQAACFVRGTRIRTLRGEVPVEQLTVSDRVVCASGDTRPVRWIGHRRIDTSRYADPSSVWPVCIRAGALADRQPLRDLRVSPGHSVLVDDHLVQAENLVNGVTVLRVPSGHVDYWHVELDAHDVLFSEGLATESYLDTGNRAAFANGATFVEAFPDFRPKHWRETCKPLATQGEALRAARARVLARAHALGYELSADPAAYVLADGEAIAPLVLSETRWAFVIPAGRNQIALCSTTFVPAHVDAASGDGRALGLCVGRLQIDGADWSLADERLGAVGWHGLERSADGHVQRWTAGHTPLPANARLIVLDLAGRGYYWHTPRTNVAVPQRFHVKSMPTLDSSGQITG